ncbi:hypothetical protein VM1G_11380 [Cytospora mali]|uniref:Uncharacterized protein n=1 Tax=Cytospora mali TaxID=578113 RepID=A0A194VQP4_CYTMA|nr:hypothetical protein VM1G_11380 [Valsa mali]
MAMASLNTPSALALSSPSSIATWLRVLIRFQSASSPSQCVHSTLSWPMGRENCGRLLVSVSQRTCTGFDLSCLEKTSCHCSSRNGCASSEARSSMFQIMPNTAPGCNTRCISASASFVANLFKQKHKLWAATHPSPQPSRTPATPAISSAEPSRTLTPLRPLAPSPFLMSGCGSTATTSKPSCLAASASVNLPVPAATSTTRACALSASLMCSRSLCTASAGYAGRWAS